MRERLLSVFNSAVVAEQGCRRCVVACQTWFSGLVSIGAQAGRCATGNNVMLGKLAGP